MHPLCPSFSTTPELGLLIQDVDGQTPLHSAVARSYSTIVRNLLRVIPKEGLEVENGVGNTPREIVALAELLKSCKDLSNVVSMQSSSGNSLSPDSIDSTIARIPVDQFSKYEAELKDLRDIVPEIVDRGTVPDERKLHMKNEIQNWVNKMLAAFKAAKKREERREAEREARKDEEEKKSQQKGLPDKTLIRLIKLISRRPLS
jgi:ankyrin repeat protein